MFFNEFSLSWYGSVPVPGQPHIIAISSTAASISLSWASTGSVVDSYEVKWRKIGSTTADEEDNDGTSGSTGGDSTGMPGDEESGTSGSITDTSYTIKELTKCTSYVITVTVTNAAGSTVSHPIRITTCKLNGKGIH